MKKRIIIGSIMIAIIALIVVLFFYINNTYSDDNIISKGYKIYGSDYCSKDDDNPMHEDSEHRMLAGTAITPYKCQLCNKKYQNPNTAIPKICSSCANITGRCMQCGKLKNK
mgnify:FL=1